MWASVDSQAKFFGILDQLAASGKCPPQLVAGFKDFYSNYRGAVVGSGAPGADEAFATRVQATIADTVFAQVCGCVGGDGAAAHAPLLDGPLHAGGRM